MISICIPVYNFNVSNMVTELHRQAEEIGELFEIILIDDSSEKEFKTENERLDFTFLRYFSLDKNIGRSRIRNLFLDYAKYDYLLFLDCDAVISEPNFIVNYLEFVKKHKPDVVCGGRVYAATFPGKDKKLRWQYGLQRESKNATIRSKAPNQSFMTNNFVIKKSIFKQNKFDETLSGYGHEDTLLGYQLNKHGIEILHIENPVTNGDIEDNSEFIRKTEEGILNLISIYKKVDDSTFIDSVTLLKTYSNLKTKGMLGLFRLQFIMSANTIKSQLEKGQAGVKAFNLYKLGFFIQNINK